MENLILGAVVAAAVALAGRYIYKARKSGAKCIGCPNGCTCGREDGCSGCRYTEE